MSLVTHPHNQANILIPNPHPTIFLFCLFLGLISKFILSHTKHSAMLWHCKFTKYEHKMKHNSNFSKYTQKLRENTVGY